ncbi:MAG: ketoacyl-ACP synthase III [Crocinitomicaceae bacterium]|nr:ketoacyl-ACP synthase III [Flavobacteriales bacterium]NQZ36854.1 ketoacyl-ACP synthase III [Crocinitomicaceae bacterium]
MKNTVIIGSGSYIPEVEVENNTFMENPFSFNDGRRIQNNNTDVIAKFQEITGIQSRRYVNKDQTCSEIASISAKRAIEDAGIDPETIDMIIVAHNFGDVISGSNQTDIVPSIASRVKHQLGIKNPFCVPYDIIFGCPGWVQGMIQAHIYIQAGEAKRCLIIGSEVLSRVVDPFDRDTMIFADGSGAVIIEGKEEETKRGILSHATVSHTLEEKDYLFFGKSFNRFGNEPTKFIKMNGHKIYQYALTEVPKAMKHCLDKIDLPLENIDKILLHQANEKMDEAILKRLYKTCNVKEIPEGIMPMIIERLGNSSVATVPTLYDMIQKGELPKHKLLPDNKLLFASVGAGMNINCIAYQV